MPLFSLYQNIWVFHTRWPKVWTENYQETKRALTSVLIHMAMCTWIQWCHFGVLNLMSVLKWWNFLFYFFLLRDSQMSSSLLLGLLKLLEPNWFSVHQFFLLSYPPLFALCYLEFNLQKSWPLFFLKTRSAMLDFNMSHWPKAFQCSTTLNLFDLVLVVLVTIAWNEIYKVLGHVLFQCGAWFGWNIFWSKITCSL